jgi:hypothetical protein
LGINGYVVTPAPHQWVSLKVPGLKVIPENEEKYSIYGTQFVL